MIKNPLGIVVILLAVESLLLFLNAHRTTQHFFKFLPHIFWMYFLPMVLSTIGIIDPQSPVYGLISGWLLPAALFLLLIGEGRQAKMALILPIKFSTTRLY